MMKPVWLTILSNGEWVVVVLGSSTTDLPANPATVPNKMMAPSMMLPATRLCFLYGHWFHLL